MARRPYITPPDIPTARISRCLSFPDSLEWEALINGFLAMGTRIENWQQLPGGVTPEEAVEACVELINDWFEAGACEVGVPIGSIVMWPSFPVPVGWLFCNGGAVLKADYPELYAAVGDQWGTPPSADFFILPSFIDTSPYGQGGEFLVDGEKAGERQHTLTNTEIPEHSHNVIDPGHSHTLTDPGHSHTLVRYGGTNAGANLMSQWQSALNPPHGTVPSTNNATTGITADSATTGIILGTVGSGQPHNNLHPITATIFIIRAL